jgi:hypothetical protein
MRDRTEAEGSEDGGVLPGLDGTGDDGTIGVGRGAVAVFFESLRRAK